jgi:predicted transcriptional regulator
MKAKIQTGSFEDFKKRAISKAQKMDRKEPVAPGITITFEDPLDMISVITDARIKLLRAAKTKSVSITELVKKTGRDRRAISRDIGVLESYGLVKTHLEPNPGHGRHKIVEVCADKFTLAANI